MKRRHETIAAANTSTVNTGRACEQQTVTAVRQNEPAAAMEAESAKKSKLSSSFLLGTLPPVIHSSSESSSDEWEESVEGVQASASLKLGQSGSRQPFIPSLRRGMVVKPSWNTAPTPTLNSFKVSGKGRVKVEWTATGTDVYKVKARGHIEGYVGSDGCEYYDKHFSVSCSCPDGQRQRRESMRSNRILVCKHAHAALLSVLDEGAEQEHQRKQAVKEAEQQHPFQQQQADTAGKLQALQDLGLAGERERITYGLHKLTSEQLVAHLTGKLKTAEGLRLLSQLFAKDVLPAKQVASCERCHQQYDPQYPSDCVCRIPHPSLFVRTRWNTSSMSWKHCLRCHADFQLQGIHVCSSFRRKLHCKGGYCFEGPHTGDPNVVQKEGWNPENINRYFREDVS